jgi:hypothetical protein
MRLIPGTSDFVEGTGAPNCIAPDHEIASARPADPNRWQASQTRVAIAAFATPTEIARSRSCTFSGSAYSCVVANDISGRYPKVNT